MKKTKIICTLGPSSEDIFTIKKLAESGANLFRLNFSHGSFEEHKKRIEAIKTVREELKLPIGIVLDTKGPEIRIGQFAGGSVNLKQGDQFTLTTRNVIGNENIVSVSYPDLPSVVSGGTVILIDDGLISMEVLKVEGTDIVCRLNNSGTLRDKKSVNIPGVYIDMQSLSQRDKEDILFGISQQVNYIAASFIRKAQDVLEIKKFIYNNGGRDIEIISKIENSHSVKNIEEIVKVSDAIMIARGDLGVEIPIETLPVVQKRIIALCKEAGKPVIVATQLLDSMIRNPRPTRAEVNDVASAVYDGCDAVMLSGETASGKYPLEALSTMAQICRNVEKNVNITVKRHLGRMSITNAVSHACCQAARDLSAKAIVTSTSSGHTAKMVARYRPDCIIAATTQHKSTYYKLSLVWGVVPLLTGLMATTDDMLTNSVNTVKEYGLINDGDIVVISGGVPLGYRGTTNIMKVHVVGDVIMRGIAIGSGSYKGSVCIVQNLHDAMEKITEGDIMVVNETDNSFIPYIKKAGAIICQSSDKSGHTTIAGSALDKIVLMCELDPISILHDGMRVTVDADRGLVINAGS